MPTKKTALISAMARKIAGALLLALFVSSMVLPLPHLMHTKADVGCLCSAGCVTPDGKGLTAGKNGFSGKNTALGRDSADSRGHCADTCPICRNAFITKKFCATKDTAPVAAQHVSGYIPACYDAPLIRLMILDARPLRAPPSASL